MTMGKIAEHTESSYHVEFLWLTTAGPFACIYTEPTSISHRTHTADVFDIASSLCHPVRVKSVVSLIAYRSSTAPTAHSIVRRAFLRVLAVYHSSLTMAICSAVFGWTIHTCYNAKPQKWA